MRYSGEFQEIVEAIDMECWLDREGVRYRHARGSSGAQLNIKTCPCCGNSDYKVYMNAASGLGNCFAGNCEARFNKWSFVSASLGGSNGETVEHMKAFAREQGWRPPRTKSVATDVEAHDLRLPESIALPHNGRNLKYLECRNISATIACYFGLRFSLRGKFAYRSEGRSVTQSYANRIIIPVFDLEGQMVSFQGRDTTGTAEKKYLFPPGFASTGTHLFNGHNAVGADRIVIGEGVFDVAATKIALDEDVALRDVVPVGSFGKHLSSGDGDSQLAKIMLLKQRGLKQVTFLWDSEPAALLAAIDTALTLRGCGLVTRVAVLPKGRDPNEVAAAEVRSAFWRAVAIDPASAAKLKMTVGRQ